MFEKVSINYREQAQYQKHFGLDVVSHGNIGLLIGAAYFTGAVVVNRTVASIGGARLLLTGAWIMAMAVSAILLLWIAGILVNLGGLIVFTAIYCMTIFGQAVLFPNSMGLAVSADRRYGSYSMSLCGFLQQSIAGIAASALALGNNWLPQQWIWVVFIFCLCALSLSLAIHNSKI